MNKYLVFSGDAHHPWGGWDDFFCHKNSKSEAINEGESAMEDGCEWYHVVDSETGQMVAKGCKVLLKNPRA